MNAQSLKDLVVQYLANELTLDGFQEELIGESWDTIAGSDPEFDLLVSEVELRLAEYTNGHLSQAELNLSLKAALYGLSLVSPSKALFVPEDRTRVVTVTAGSSGQRSAVTSSPTLSSWAGRGLEEVRG